MKLMSLMLGETGTYGQQYFRPYHSDVKDTSIVLAAIEATQHGQRTNTGAMASVANQIIRPVSEVQGDVNISNGWNERRFQFVLHLDVSPRGDGSIGEIVSGYTDHVGFLNGCFDPNMKLYFNNSMMMRAIISGPVGAAHSNFSITDSSQILRGNYNPGFDSNQVGSLTMRPEDVYCTMQHSVADFSGSNIIDSRTSFIDPIKKSSRRNNHTPEYLSRLVNGLKHAYTTANHSGDNFADILDNARDHVVEALITKDFFLNHVRTMSGDMSRDYITFGELQRMDPTIGDRTTVTITGEMQRGQSHMAGQTEHWGGSNSETILATAFVNGLSSLMMANGLHSAAFSITNHTLDGSFFYKMLSAKSVMDNLDVVNIVENALMPRLITEVLNPLTYNSNMAITIQVEARLLSEIRLDISVGGNPPIPYCMPCFADALVAPVLTNDFMNIQSMAKDIDMLYNNISESNHQSGVSYGTAGTV